MSASNFVDQLYTNLLQRDTDTEGKTYWVNALDEGAISSVEITRTLLESAEYQSTVAEVCGLYFLLFDRLPDTDGMSYWVDRLQAGTSLGDVTQSFIESAEFEGLYGSESSNEGFLDALYQNAFGRSADTEGKAYWREAMADGLSQAEVIQAFAHSAEGQAITAAQVQVTGAYQGVLARLPTADELAQASSDLNTLISDLYNHTDYSGEPLPDAQPLISGKVIDGYVSGSTVFMDQNGNGILDSGEISTRTDANGDFSLLNNGGRLTAFGGTDISTGQAFAGVMTAPDGSTIISPVTTVLTQLLDNGQQRGDAQSLLAQRMGLDTSLNLTTFDPLAAATQTGADDAAVRAALQVQSANLQLITSMAQTSGLLQGAADGGLNLERAFDAASGSIAQTLLGLPQQDTGGNVVQLDLTDTATLEGLVNGAATNLTEQPEQGAELPDNLVGTVTGMAGDVASMMADANRNIGTALGGATAGTLLDALRDATQTQSVALGDALDALINGASNGDLTGVRNDFTGDALNQRADDVDIEDDALTGDGVYDAPEGQSPADGDAGDGTVDPGAGGSSGGSSSGGASGGSGSGSGTTTPAATFTVDVTGNVISFAGTATGEITAAHDGTNWTFMRDGITADPVAVSGHSIELDSGQSLQVSAADAESITIGKASGATNTTVTVTALEDNTSATLNSITVDSVVLQAGDHAKFTGTNASSPGTALSYEVTNGTLTLSENQADNGIVSGSGSVLVAGLAGDTILTNITVDGTVKATVTSSADISGNTTLGDLEAIDVASGETVTLKAAQAADISVAGVGGTTVMGSDGNQTFTVLSTGANSISGGSGADVMTLGIGTGIDTIVVGGAVAARTEEHELTFQSLIAGQSVTVDGLTLTASGSIAAADVAAGFASLSASASTGNVVTKGAWSGALSTGWSSGMASGAAVTFTSETADTDVADIVVSSAGVSAIAAPTDVSVADTQGSAAQTEKHALTFQDLVAGQFVTVDGLTLTANGSITAANVAAGFANLKAGAGIGNTVTNGAWSGALSTGWSSGMASGAAVTFTSVTLITDVSDIVVFSAGVAPFPPPTDVSITDTQGSSAQTEKHALTFQDLVAGQSVTVDGLMLTASGSITAADVAAGFANLSAGASIGNVVTDGAWTGALSAGWSSGTVNGAEVTFTSGTPTTDVADIVVSSAGVAAITAPTNVGTVSTQGVTAQPASDSTVSLPATGILTDRMDSIINFDFAEDKLDLGFGNSVLSGTSTSHGDITAIASGILTFANTAAQSDAAGFTAKLTAVFTELAATNDAAAFVHNGHAYVVQGDGISGMGDGDIVVELSGISDLSTVGLSDMLA